MLDREDETHIAGARNLKQLKDWLAQRLFSAVTCKDMPEQSDHKNRIHCKHLQLHAPQSSKQLEKNEETHQSPATRHR